MFSKTLLMGAGLMAMVSAAHATDSVDLKVTGKLINGSCTPSLENGGGSILVIFRWAILIPRKLTS